MSISYTESKQIRDAAWDAFSAVRSELGAAWDAERATVAISDAVGRSKVDERHYARMAVVHAQYDALLTAVDELT